LDYRSKGSTKVNQIKKKKIKATLFWQKKIQKTKVNKFFTCVYLGSSGSQVNPSFWPD
jgi:hypothetical protein